MAEPKKKKYALVTGANKGLGFEISRRLGFAGYNVYMCGRTQSKLEQAAGLLRGEGHTMFPMAMDVTQPEDINKAVETLRAAGVQLDALIHNATVMLDDDLSLLEVPDQDVFNTFMINALGPLRLTRALMPLMKSGSRIVMVSSEAGRFCNGLSDFAPVFSMSKTALNVVTRRLAKELESRNIVVNAASPGDAHDTDIIKGETNRRTLTRSAETPVWLATEVPLVETGKFWRDKLEINW